MLTTCVLTAGLFGFLPQSPSPTANPTMPVQDRVLRVISIRQVSGAARAPQPPRLRTLLQAPAVSLSHSLLEDWNGDRSLVKPEGFRLLVERLLPEGIRAAPEVSITAHRGRLVISGPPEAVESIVRVVRSTAAALVRDVEIRATLYRAPARDVPVVAGATELREITADLRPVWRARAVTRAGNPVALANERLTPYLATVVVEVASRAQIGAPAMWTLFEGVRLVVQPHVLAGSRDVVLMCQVAVGERRGELRTISTGVQGLPNLDVPDLDVLLGAFSGRVPDGGALLVSCRATRELGGSFLLVVSARQRQAPPPPAEDLAYLPVSALLSASLRSEARVVDPDDSGSRLQLAPQLEFDAPSPASDAGFSTGEITNLLRDLVGAGNREGSFVERIGGHLVIRDRPEFVRAAAALITELEDRSLRTVAVSVSSVRDATERSEVVQRIDLPVLLGRPHAMVCGRETTALADFEAEIAERSAISYPVVRRVFAGLLVTADIYGEEDSRVLRAEVVAAGMSEPRRRPTGGKGGGELFVPRVTNAHHAYDGPLGDGVVDLGLGPVFDGTPTRQILRVTPLR